MNSSLCLNPECRYENPANHQYCSQCRCQLNLCDRYRAIQFIGEGAFGRTFKAIDQQRLNTPCVIKQFLPVPGSSGYGKAKQLFEEEAKQLWELTKHPKIPELLAFFEQEERLYLVQDFIDGYDLEKILDIKKRFSEQEVHKVLMQLLPCLQFIHEKNIIHRDIKPSNILCTKDGSLYLIDFGISKQLGGNLQGTQAVGGTVAGTPGYAAPEQFRGMIHPTSDLYSLGVMAIRLLTGCVVREENGTLVDDLFDLQSMSWVWRDWSTNNSVTVSNELANILDKMIQDKVSDRFPSAQAVLNALNTSQDSDHFEEIDKGFSVAANVTLPVHIFSFFKRFKNAYDKKNIVELEELFSDNYTGTLNDLPDKKSFIEFFEHRFDSIPFLVRPFLKIKIYKITKNTADEFQAILEFSSDAKVIFINAFSIAIGKVDIHLLFDKNYRAWKVLSINTL